MSWNLNSVIKVLPFMLQVSHSYLKGNQSHDKHPVLWWVSFPYRVHHPCWDHLFVPISITNQLGGLRDLDTGDQNTPW